MKNKEVLKEIAQVLTDINFLSTTQYDRETIINFAKIIIKINPNTTAQDVENLMTKFFTGKEEFNPNKGVRNFTIPLNTLKRKRNEL